MSTGIARDGRDNRGTASGKLIQAERFRQGRPSGSSAVSLLRGMGAGLKKLKLLSLPLSTRILSNTQRESRATRTINRVRSIINFLITGPPVLNRSKTRKSELYINRLEIFKTLINCLKILELCDKSAWRINTFQLLRQAICLCRKVDSPGWILKS